MRIATFALIFAAGSQPAAAEFRRCENPLFSVETDDPALAERTCRSAETARARLLSCGIAIETPVDIDVVGEVTGAFGACLGLYHCGENRFEILDPAAMALAREADSAFAGVSDDAFWESVLVHELTHAAYDRVTCPFSSCVATSEFAAYAMQVLSLPPEDQARFGETVTLSTEPSSAAISEMIYFMAPDKFAKIAWLHFKAQPDPCGYLERIMDGEIFFDREAL
jgi:hypothetical protein